MGFVKKRVDKLWDMGVCTLSNEPGYFRYDRRETSNGHAAACPNADRSHDPPASA
jgi:hypothetical protein